MHLFLVVTGLEEKLFDILALCTGRLFSRFFMTGCPTFYPIQNNHYYVAVLFLYLLI